MLNRLFPLYPVFVFIGGVVVVITWILELGLGAVYAVLTFWYKE